jgi:hypothetical protein
MKRIGRTPPFNERQILGYLISWHKLDVQAIRREIYTPEVAELMKAGVTTIHVHNRSLVLKIKDNQVTTVHRSYVADRID